MCSHAATGSLHRCGSCCCLIPIQIFSVVVRYVTLCAHLSLGSHGGAIFSRINIGIVFFVCVDKMDRTDRTQVVFFYSLGYFDIVTPAESRTMLFIPLTPQVTTLETSGYFSGAKDGGHEERRRRRRNRLFGIRFDPGGTFFLSFFLS